MTSRVLLYWPNVIGYVRICLLFGAWTYYESPSAFLPLYSSSILLDAVDGWVARRLQQVSRFGAWLDVVIDNLSRGMIWTQVCQDTLVGPEKGLVSFSGVSLVSPKCPGPLHQVGWLVSSLEWCVFVCNHSSRGEHWKNSFSSSPRIIQTIMSNGFRSPLGLLVVSGLHLLPLWFYCLQLHVFQPQFWIQLQVSGLLLLGRGLACVAEVWCIWTHITFLTKDEEKIK